MSRLLFALVVVPMFAGAAAPPDGAGPIVVGPNDWPWWRGPNRNGVAETKQKPPIKWSETENVLWKAPVPGRGHGAPIVVGEHVLLATADFKEQTQSVLCHDRRTGKLVWHTTVHRGGLTKAGNSKSTLASATLASDGQRIFCNFLNNQAIYTTALDRAGKQLWQTKVTDYVLHQGFGSSPAVYQALVIVSADNKGKGVLAALERDTGKFVWKVQRPKMPNYASPVILKVAGRDQLFFIGCELVTSLDPLTGKTNWEIPGATTECVTSTVTDGRLIITSGGFPKNHVAAIHADGSGKVAWESKTKVYVPSMIERDGYLYAVQDGGIASCWKFDTGKEVWKARLGGAFTASLILVGDRLYAANESGRTFIFKADPNGFEAIAENQLGDEVMATPAICGGRIYLRVAVNQKGQRREFLYCLGQ
ncbi:MAG: PQQ-binding-like beta-propeller repeat protein [Planctomycetes bacterium]|nr:PQQ-binding-like beta-propeller repeat protein [Planctomycetota bacterium]